MGIEELFGSGYGGLAAYSSSNCLHNAKCNLDG